MFRISKSVTLPDSDLVFSAVRASGPGGQNVNKVATAVYLRFDIGNSSLPAFYKERLRKLDDRRISSDGVIVIKAQRFRSQEKNREAAMERLRDLICSAASTPRRRIATQPTRAARQRRIDDKKRRGQQKTLRRGVEN